MTRKNRRGGRNQRTSTVQVVDGDVDNRALKVERMVRAVREAQSFTRVLVKGRTTVDIPSADVTGQIDFLTAYITDEFVTYSSQYRAFRVSAIKYDVFDIAPNNITRCVFGVYHTVNNDRPANSGQVFDLPDSTEIAPGTGRHVYYWYPSGVQERQFLSTEGATANYGGLAYTITGSATPAPKYDIVFTYVLDFRARK